MKMGSRKKWGQLYFFKKYVKQKVKLLITKNN